MKHIKNWKAVNTAFKAYCNENRNDALADSWRERLDAADKAPKITEIKIRVLYRRGREGVNATATLWLTMEDEEFGHISAYGYGHAGGGGYDKASAAVNEAMWFKGRRADTQVEKDGKVLARAALDRFVIEHGEKMWNEYAIDRTPVPHFSIAGKGMSTLTRLFRSIGSKYPENPACEDFVIDYDESAKNQDTYHIVRKDVI